MTTRDKHFCIPAKFGNTNDGRNKRTQRTIVKYIHRPVVTYLPRE